MDFSSATRPAPISATNATPRADILAARNSVPVDLPPEKTVQSAQAGDAVLFEIRTRTREESGEAAAQRRTGADRQQEQLRADQLREGTVERRLVIDTRSRSIVLQEKDPDTGETISQLPDEALLKLRIYSRELTDRARQNSEPSPSVERTA